MEKFQSIQIRESGENKWAQGRTQSKCHLKFMCMGFKDLAR